jgi:HAD superfamily 5'-nucleotidase-like hydrolase
LAQPISIHGGYLPSTEAEQLPEAERKAQELLSDPELRRWLSAPRPKRDIDRSRQVFINRNLRMSKVEVVGFDMDYTLAIYHMRRIEQLSFDMTIQRLISDKGYSPEISQVQYIHQFVMRGLVVDKKNGNLIKMDRFGHVGRAYHGLKPLPVQVWHKLYRNERIRLKDPQYAWIDTLFALPEACLFSGIIELFESLGRTVDYAKLYDDIRESIDTVHRDNTLKQEIRKDIGRFIFKDPELGPALHKLRSGGKKLFLLTNSLWDYTDAVMTYLLDGVLAEYPSWRNYFDFVVTGAAKPAFFSENQPFFEIDPSTEEGKIVREATSLEKGKVYQGGNLSSFQRFTGYASEGVLYVGDHIYGDILKSKKASLWRTCMVVQEIEDEINYTASKSEAINRLSEIELIRARLDDEVNRLKAQLNLLDRKLERAGPTDESRAELQAERKRQKPDLDRARKTLKQTTEIADVLEKQVEEGFNPFWGLMFKEGNENSRFGEQVEQYACIYTSRVSNFLHYSPMQYYRSPRDLMPHEQAGALSGKLSPLGSEGPPKGAE